jgi:squalene cyclase
VSATKFTDENRAQLLAKIAAGATLEEASRGCEIRPKTVAGWLTRGRQEANGPYFDFAAAVEGAREKAQAAASKAMTPAEFNEHLAKAIRAGSVSAMKLFHEIRRDQKGDDPGDEFDNL